MPPQRMNQGNLKTHDTSASENMPWCSQKLHAVFQLTNLSIFSILENYKMIELIVTKRAEIRVYAVARKHFTGKKTYLDILMILNKLRNVIQNPQHLTHIVIQLKACLVLVKG